MPPFLYMQDVAFQWNDDTQFRLQIADFAVEQGETVLILGDSGAGKSTLLSLICGVVAPNSGVVSIAGVDVAKLNDAQRDSFRAEHIGVIFQQFNLLPFGTVLDNIRLPLKFSAKRKQRAQTSPDDATQLCQALGLPLDILKQRASKLSVGQQQRVAVARALIGQPPLVIADEPTSALDSSNQSAFLKLLFNQIKNCQTTLIMVSHDTQLARYFDRTVKLDDVAHRAGVIS